jgi:hypothetical protein
MLRQAAVVFVEAEHGSVARIADVRRDITRQYPDAVDLGVLPRDARIVSSVAEREGFCSVYDIEPRGRYCQALEAACDRLITHLQLPAPAQTGHPLAQNGRGGSAGGGFLRFLGIGRANPSREEHPSWS